MNRLVSVVAIAVALAAAGSGCCCMDRYYYGDCPRAGLFGFGGQCGDGQCGGGPEMGCAGGHCGGGGCNDCATAPCGGCGECDLCCANPLRALFNAFQCSSGCGELYVDEWINDPPDKCDPCDQHGHYVGHGPCKPRWFLGTRNLCGYRCAENCDTCCGFEPPGHCGTGCDSCTEGAYGDGEVIHDHGIPAEPVPAPMPEMMDNRSAARRTAKPYYKTPAAPRRVTQSPAKVRSQPTPAARRVSHEVTPTTAKSPVGTGVHRR